MENYSELTDEQLVALSRDNDSKATGELSLRYNKIALSIASKFSFDSEECADLSQEGMIGFLSAVYSYSFEERASFATYASCCIRNRIISVLRKSNSQKRVPEELILSLEQLGEHTCDSETPEQVLISQNGAQYISALIEKLLSEQEKKVLKLFLSGMSYDDIAKKTELSSKAVDSTLQRARKKLRKELKDNR